MGKRDGFNGNADEADDRSSADRLLLSAVDMGLAGVIFVAPYFMGGRHPLGELVLVALALLASVAWFVRQALLAGSVRWTRCAAELVLLAGLGLVLLQLVPLPSAAFEILSPHSADTLPLWNPAAGAAQTLGEWNQVTMLPEATRAGLVMFLTYALLFLVCVQRLGRVEDVERMIGWMAISAGMMAAFGIVQYLFSNGRFLWFYEHPSRNTYDAVTGPFINKNHYAHLLALGVGPLVWALQRGIGRMRSPAGRGFGSNTASGATGRVIMLAIALGLVLFAGLMTLSRGGAAALLLATAVSVVALYRAEKIGRRGVLGIAGACLVMSAALAIHGYQQVSQRLDDYATGSIEDLDPVNARRKLWEADGKGAVDYLPAGTGVGSHREVYPMYYGGIAGIEFTHAENGYLQVALETGLPGLVLLLSGLGLCGLWCLRGLRSRAADERLFLLSAAVSAGLAVSAAHSLVDFPWYIPSLMAMTCLLAACAFRLAQFALPSNRTNTSNRCQSSQVFLSKGVCAAAVAAILLAGAWMSHDRFCAAMAAPHWDSYLSCKFRIAEGAAPTLSEAAEVEHLREIVRWTPDSATAHLRLARLYLRCFSREQEQAENKMPLSQIRDAAIASRSQLQSRAQLEEWLKRAVGEPYRYLDLALWHTHRGLALCPLKGEGYANLAELCFLEGGDAAMTSACVAQGLKVRPYDGTLLLAAGGECFLAQKFDQAIGYWKLVMQNNLEEKLQLVKILAASGVPLDFVVESFSPPTPALASLLQEYAAVATSRQLHDARSRYAQLLAADASLSTCKAPAALWLRAGQTHEQLNDPDQALRCLSQAIASDPTNYEAHATLAEFGMAHGRYAEAEEHFGWCAVRKASDKSLTEKTAAAARLRIDQESRLSAKGNASDSRY